MNALRRALVFTHRWLGIIGCVLFAAWFVSGIVMMYARMPRLSAEERLMRVPPLNVSTVRVAPSVAARSLDGPPQRLRIGMLGARPVYRFLDAGRWVTIFADSGERLASLDPAAALAIAQTFTGDAAVAIHHDGRLETPDQWTLQLRALLPAQRIALDGSDHRYLYVSESTGEVVLTTSWRTRMWGYAGAVVHWIYFTPVRQNGAVWTEIIIWTSIAGCVLCASGLLWGVWQLTRAGGTPYAGLMRWHHYAGLVFGVFAFTFVFSGLLSMNPWDVSPSTSATPAQRAAIAGGRLTLDGLSIPRLRLIAQTLGRAFVVKEIELLQFQGRLYAEAHRPPTSSDVVRWRHDDPGAVVAPRIGLEHRLVAVDMPERGTFSRFSDVEIAQAAGAVMPGQGTLDATWLADYDSYYYDRDRALPLPVLRVRYSDAAATWLYFDPYRGAIIRREERRSRVNRWLYHGLHSLDFPWLYRHRPLWDGVVVVLSIGGLFVTVSSAPSSWRRLRLRLARWTRR